MVDRFSPTPQQSLLTRFVDLHEHDELSPEHHRALVRRFTSARELALYSERRASTETRRNKHYLFRTATAGVGLLVLAATWALWFRRVPISPEPVARVSVAATAEPSLGAKMKPCFVAAGHAARLWDPDSAGLDAPSEDGRFGSWVHFRNDGAEGQRLPIQVILLDSNSSQHALRIDGPTTAGWGAKLSVGLRARPKGTDGVHLECYDASAYRGLQFRASGTGIVQVVLQTADSIPVNLGGSCTGKCWFSSSRAVALDSSFKDFEIPWHQFGPDDTEHSTAPRLMMVDFVVQATEAPYSFTLASVGFMKD